jgi:hypothetical protein
MAASVAHTCANRAEVLAVLREHVPGLKFHQIGQNAADALTVAEKVRLLEQVWQSLCCQPDSIASPDWHSDVLMERRQQLLNGSKTCMPWHEAKARLQRLAE